MFDGWNVKALLGVAMSPIVALLGGWDAALQSLLLLMVVNFISGIAKGFVTRSLDSEVAWRGGIKKLMLMLAVMVATTIDALLAVGLAGSPLVGIIDQVGFRTVLILYFCGGEGLSFAENAAAAGVPLPGVLTDALARLHESGGVAPPAKP